MVDTDAVSKWNQFYKDGPNKGNIAYWPNENLVRILKGSYFPWYQESYEHKKVVDIGFGSGNNLMLCGSMGMELHGVEIHYEICTSTQKYLSKLGYNAELKEGSNRNIPYDNDSFDYLISWDAIHYERRPDRISAALKEFARVLKPGGRLFMSTVAPKHTIFQDSKIVGHHQYLLCREDDFRKGQIFFSFDSKRYIHYFFSNDFQDISVGRSTLDYFNEVNDTFLITAVKAFS